MSFEVKGPKLDLRAVDMQHFWVASCCELLLVVHCRFGNHLQRCTLELTDLHSWGLGVQRTGRSVQVPLVSAAGLLFDSQIVKLISVSQCQSVSVSVSQCQSSLDIAIYCLFMLVRYWSSFEWSTFDRSLRNLADASLQCHFCSFLQGSEAHWSWRTGSLCCKALLWKLRQQSY